MNNIKAVIFDMDGVIFDTERIYLEDWTTIFKEYGYDMKRELYLSVMGKGRKKVKEVFKESFGNNLPIEEMYIKKDKLLWERIKEGIALKEGVFEILDFLETSGYKIALATSAKKDRLDEQFIKSSISKKFDVVVCGDDVTNSKPDPEIFLKAASLLDTKPEECIVIEDSEAGIRAAYNAKMIPLHVKDLKDADEDITKYSYKNFENLIEIKKFLSSL